VKAGASEQRAPTIAVHDRCVALLKAAVNDRHYIFKYMAHADFVNQTGKVRTSNVHFVVHCR